ncbi:glycosyltransferase family 4 protein [bacterium]|nr:glycosyltransferase family 4 protein [bacterium]
MNSQTEIDTRVQWTSSSSPRTSTRRGGAVAAAAVQRLRREGLEVSLSVVGDRPPAQIEEMRGVTYRGWLKKSDPVQRQEFIDLLSGSRALIHPTLADMNPLILFEAAYHGCPAVSSRRFAIPEFLEDGRNGFLLEEPRSTEELAAAMSQLAQMSPPDYAAMRLEAWRRSRQRATPEAFNARLLHEIQIGASHAF